MSEKITNFVDEERAAMQLIASGIHALDALHQEYDTLGYNALITQGDLTGLNADVTPQMLADGFNLHNQLNSTLDAGYRIYLYNLLR